MFIDGAEQGKGPNEQALSGEYPRLYAQMTKIVATKSIDMDLRPMVLVADAMALGERRVDSPFDW